ncbi:MAG: MATE family efflux transporter [Phycisphaerae bacterium]
MPADTNNRARKATTPAERPPGGVPDVSDHGHSPVEAYVPVADEPAYPEPTPLGEEIYLESLPLGSLNRQVFILALPMLGEQLVNFCVGFVDTFLAGQVGKEATAAVGTGGYLSWFVTLGFALIGTGAAALVARAFGARDLKTARRATNQAFVLALALGAGMTGLVYFSAPLLADFLTQTAAAQAMMVTYVRIDAFGFVLYSTVLICGGVIRAAGDTRTPMIIMVIVNIINAVVSATLVFGWLGPPLGVKGIAIGTVVARSLGGVLLLAVLLRGLRGLQLRLAALRPHWETIRRMLRVGLPAAGEASVMWIAQICFIKIIVHTATGETATANYAAHMIAVRMTAITYLPAAAWMTAAATLVGQYLGAGRPDRSARAAHVAAMQGAVLTTGVGVAFFVLADLIYQLMSLDPAVRAVGAPAFRVGAFIHPFLCTGIIYIGALRGAGDTRWTMIFSLIGGILLRIPLAYLGGIVLGGGLIGAWCGMWADNLAKFLLGLTRMLHGGWRKVKV